MENVISGNIGPHSGALPNYSDIQKEKYYSFISNRKKKIIFFFFLVYKKTDIPMGKGIEKYMGQWVFLMFFVVIYITIYWFIYVNGGVTNRKKKITKLGKWSAVFFSFFNESNFYGIIKMTWGGFFPVFLTISIQFPRIIVADNL